MGVVVMLGRVSKAMARLAQCMADGCPTLIEASRRLNMTEREVDVLWGYIVKDLGWQAT